jgi:hypothetical protein
MKSLQEIISVFVGEEQVAKIDLGDPRQAAADEILDAGLRRSGHCDGIAIAAQTGVDPQDVNLSDRPSCPIF